MSTVLYVPVAIKTPRINSELLIKLFNLNAKKHSTGLWNYWTIKFKPYEFYDDRWEKRYVNDNVVPIWDETFKNNFSNCVKFLDKLPFTELTHINLLYQIVDIPSHLDYHKNENNYKNQLCYKWLILPGEKNSFYIENKNKKIFLNPPENFRCFCIPESYIKHGAIKNNTNKIIMSIFGKLDKEKHNILIEKSLEKFNEHSISE